MPSPKTHPAARRKAGAKNANVIDRRRKVWELRKDGHSYQSIAEICGVSKALIQNDVKVTLEEVQEETRAEAESYRTIQVQRLEDLMRSVRRTAQDEEHPDQHNAIDRALRIESQLAKLMGTEELPIQRTEDLTNKIDHITLDFSGVNEDIVAMTRETKPDAESS